MNTHSSWINSKKKKKLDFLFSCFRFIKYLTTPQLCFFFFLSNFFFKFLFFLYPKKTKYWLCGEKKMSLSKMAIIYIFNKYISDIWAFWQEIWHYFFLAPLIENYFVSRLDFYSMFLWILIYLIILCEYKKMTSFRRKFLVFNSLYPMNSLIHFIQ